MTARRSSGDFWPSSGPRLPGPGKPRPSGRRPFGRTWWGAAWVDALENRARLDPNRLPRGRTYARSGAVGALDIQPGEVLALVQGSRKTPYQVRVRVRAFDTGEWDRLLDALSSKIGHTAALLDGELLPEIAADATSIGLDLLPGPGELQPRCSCPDWADPCKHAAAVCYLVADALDSDPFGVLLLRGRTRSEVLAALRSRRSTFAAASPRATPAGLESSAGGQDPGIAASEAFGREVAPLPLLPLPTRVPGHPTVLGVDPPPGLGVDAGALRDLASDVARRALELALGAPGTGLELSEGEDLARRAAAHLAPEPATSDPSQAMSSVRAEPDGEAISLLARRAGIAPRALLRRALAWQVGGQTGLATLEERFDPPSGALESGRALLGPGASARQNRLTLGDRQLRLGRDGRWYPFSRSADRSWDPAGHPLEDPRGWAGDASLDVDDPEGSEPGSTRSAGD